MTVGELLEDLNSREVEYEIMGPADVCLAFSPNSIESICIPTKYTHIVLLEDYEICYLICGTYKTPAGDPDWGKEDEVEAFLP